MKNLEENLIKLARIRSFSRSRRKNPEGQQTYGRLAKSSLVLAGGRGACGGLGHAPARLRGTFAELSQAAKQTERERKLLHPQKEQAEPGNCPRDKDTAAQRPKRPRERAKHAFTAAGAPRAEHGVFPRQIPLCRGTVAPPLLCDNLGLSPGAAGSLTC